jgi:feruloyl esterase
MRTAPRKLCVAGILAAAVSGLPLLAPPARAATCAELTELSLANMKIQASADVPAGTLTVAGVAGKPMTLTVPELCRVQVQATPTPDSAIGFQVWLPGQRAWNGKLLGIGNGGYSSVPDYPAMVDGLNRGYAVVATNQGHEGEDLRFVIGHPTKIDDWADRAIHVMTVGAKAIVRDRNGVWPSRSYFDGCSTGGFQGMAETQRYPADYDGVIAGAPGYPRTSLIPTRLKNHPFAGSDCCDPVWV